MNPMERKVFVEYCYMFSFKAIKFGSNAQFKITLNYIFEQSTFNRQGNDLFEKVCREERRFVICWLINGRKIIRIGND